MTQMQSRWVGVSNVPATDWDTWDGWWQTPGVRIDPSWPPGAGEPVFGRPSLVVDPSPASGPPVASARSGSLSTGWLRAAVFGAMDGLVTNVALIAGVVGGGVGPREVVLTGLAGLLAGAVSMALGEYASVLSSNEQVAKEVDRERAELAADPAGEQEELAVMLTSRGLPAPCAHRVAADVSQYPEFALRLHVLEELGVAPDERPSPVLAAVSSFGCFTVGALVPLLPYLLGSTTLWPALAAGGAGLFLCGALVSRVTQRNLLASGLRQLLFGALAAGATFAVGRLIASLVG